MQGWRMDMVRCTSCWAAGGFVLQTFRVPAVSQAATLFVQPSPASLAPLSCLPLKGPNLLDNSFRASPAVANLLLQEDAHAIELDLQSDGKPKASMFGVFDGHGGKEVARFTAMHIVSFDCRPVRSRQLHCRRATADVAAMLPPVPTTWSRPASGLVMPSALKPHMRPCAAAS